MSTAPVSEVSPRRGGRLHALQILRGSAAALVVVAHIIEHPQASVPDAVIRMGRFGVELFFVISGIIIAEVAGNARFDPRRFVIHRFFRVVPLYWVTTLLVAGCALWFPTLFKTTTFELTAFVKSMLFIPAPDPTNANDWRPTYKLGWTLNYEVFFYAVMVAFFWARSSLRRAVGVTLVLGTLIGLGAVPKDGKTIWSFYANLDLLPFLIGLWLSQARREGLLDRVPLPAIGVLGLVTCAVVATFFSIPLSDLSDTGPHLLMALAASLMLLFGLVIERRVDWTPYRWLETIGDNSYSLYLVHMFIVGAAVAVLHRAGVHGVLFWAAMGVAFLVTLLAANLSYRLLELPINRLGKLVGRSDKARAAAIEAGYSKPVM